MADAPYATQAQLTAWLGGEALPSRVDKRLKDASRLIDSYISGAVYRTDPTTHAPTDAIVAEVLRDATCAQVEWWMETNDPLGQMNEFHSISDLDAGTSVQRSGRRSALAPEARRILRLAGLLSAQVIA